MILPVAYLLIAGGVTALTPLLSRISKGLSKFVSFLGFFVGIAVIAVSVILALDLNLAQFGLVLGVPTSSQLTSRSPWLQYFLPVMVIIGTLLFSRPIRNVHWASLVSLGLGVLGVYGVRVLLGVGTTVVLGVVFLVITVLAYAVLRFVEDIFDFVASFLALPPVEIIMGLLGVYFGILILSI
jgi:hypothetical protein